MTSYFLICLGCFLSIEYKDFTHFKRMIYSDAKTVKFPFLYSMISVLIGLLVSVLLPFINTYFLIKNILKK